MVMKKQYLTVTTCILALLASALLYVSPAHSKFYSLDKARNPHGANVSNQFKSLRSGGPKAIKLNPNGEKSFSLQRYGSILQSVEKNRAIAQEKELKLASLATEPERTSLGPKVVKLNQDGSQTVKRRSNSKSKAAKPSEVTPTFRVARPGGSRIKHSWPIEKTARQYISSLFGMREDPFTGKPALHAGLDIAAAKGTTVLASADGTVTGVGTHPRLGQYVKVTHQDSSYSLYGHLSETHVVMGDNVRRHQKIAEVGSTGRSTGNHLDYSLRIDGSPVDPLDYLTPPTGVSFAKNLRSMGGDG